MEEKPEEKEKEPLTTPDMPIKQTPMEADAAISENTPLDTQPDQGYFPAGRLTRLPAPLIDIDLNVPEINQTAFTGQVELTILIDAGGQVFDVVPASIDSDDAKVFAEHVAKRFKSARFSPGEIGGKAVNSQLTITVISEGLLTLPRK